MVVRGGGLVGFKLSVPVDDSELKFSFAKGTFFQCELICKQDFRAIFTLVDMLEIAVFQQRSIYSLMQIH